jgi:hypothetical protein
VKFPIAAIAEAVTGLNFRIGFELVGKKSAI